MKAAVHVYWFESSSGSGSYETIRYNDGTVSCNCPGWTKRTRNGGRECKHTRAVLSGCGDQMAKTHGVVGVILATAEGADERTPGKPQRRFNFD
jgi:hypothetical protein